MASRLEKYHKQSAEEKKRSERNKELYENLYEDAEYTNIENISRIEKTDEVDLQKIREMLNRQVKSTNQLSEDEQIEENKSPIEEEMPEYDVRKFLDEAKKNREDEDERKRSLDSSYHQVFRRGKKEEGKDDAEKLKELIHTITSTKVLKDLNDKELSEKLLNELQEEASQKKEKEETTIEVKEKQEGIIPKDSFYTNSLKFKNDDFEGMVDLEEAVTSSSKLMRVLLCFLLIGMLVISLYIVMVLI